MVLWEILQRVFVMSPKPKPDEIVRHEIVLGRAERELLTQISGAYTFNRISTPIVAGLSDASFVIVVTGLTIAFIDTLLSSLGLDPSWRELTDGMDREQLKDWLETQNLVGAGFGAILGSVLLGPAGVVAGITGALVGAGAGTAAVELGEATAELVEEQIDAASTNVGVASGLATLSRLLSNLRDSLPGA